MDTRLLGEPQLLHEVAAVPEQPFVIHPPVDPVTDRRHRDGEALAGRRNTRTVRERHWAGEGPGHHPGDRSPTAGAEANRMHLDGDIRRVYEECFKVLDMPLDALGFVAIRPSDDDVVRVTLPQPVPFLIAEYVKVEDVKELEVGFHGRRLHFGRRRRELRMFRGRLRRGASARETGR